LTMIRGKVIALTQFSVVDRHEMGHGFRQTLTDGRRVETVRRKLHISYFAIELQDNGVLRRSRGEGTLNDSRDTFCPKARFPEGD
jgi:hypothetical protein